MRRADRRAAARIGYRWWPHERHGSIAFTSAARRLFADHVSERGLRTWSMRTPCCRPLGGGDCETWEVPFVLTDQSGPFSMMVQTAWQRWQVGRALAGGFDRDDGQPGTAT
ncbi:MAG: hypothetical protein U1A27_02620 [Phycisphaerae bacterium]